MAYTEEQKRDHTREVQTFLHGLSHTRNLTHVTPDGFYGPQTSAAVQQFQQQNRINPTGETDTITWNALADAYQNEVQIPTIQLSIFPTGINAFVLNDEGTAIYILQAILQALNRQFTNLQPVDNSGIYDEKTRNAVQTFQENTHLTPNGEVDRNTWNHLLSALAPQIEFSWNGS